jgi:hypothetical protein
MALNNFELVQKFTYTIFYMMVTLNPAVGFDRGKLLLNAVVPVNPEYEPLRMTAKNDLVGCRLLQEVLHLEWKCTEVFVLQI